MAMLRADMTRPPSSLSFSKLLTTLSLTSHRSTSYARPFQKSDVGADEWVTSEAETETYVKRAVAEAPTGPAGSIGELLLLRGRPSLYYWAAAEGQAPYYGLDFLSIYSPIPPHTIDCMGHHILAHRCIVGWIWATTESRGDSNPQSKYWWTELLAYILLPRLSLAAEAKRSFGHFPFSPFSHRHPFPEQQGRTSAK